MNEPTLVFDFKNIKELINKKYYLHLWTTDRYFYMVGSAGSGKSHFAAEKFVYRSFTEKIGHRFLVIRRYTPQLETSAFRLILDYLSAWNLLDFCKVKIKPMEIKFKNGNEILFRGLDDLEKVKSIEGITGIWYEEATEASITDIWQLNLRLRPTFKLSKEQKEAKRNGAFIGDYAQIMCSYNPISKQNWTFKENHIAGKLSYRKQIITEVEYPKGKFNKITAWKTVLHSTYTDNIYLALEYVAQIENFINLDYAFYLIYAKGEYADLKNKIYNNYKIVKAFPDIGDIEKEIYGLDFGYTHPMALIRTQISGNKRCVKTIIHERELLIPDFIKKLKKMKFPKDKIIYADDARPEAIQEIHDAGYTIYPAYKGKKSVKDGLDYCKNLEVYILESDIELKEEFYFYKYQEDPKITDSSGQPLVKEDPVKFKDDGLDAWRYAEYTDHLRATQIPRVFDLSY